MTMQISPRGLEIDTDAKHEPKLLWNNSGGFLSKIFGQREKKKQVLCLKIVKMQSFIIQISGLRIAIDKC